MLERSCRQWHCRKRIYNCLAGTASRCVASHQGHRPVCEKWFFKTREGEEKTINMMKLPATSKKIACFNDCAPMLQRHLQGVVGLSQNWSYQSSSCLPNETNDVETSFLRCCIAQIKTLHTNQDEPHFLGNYSYFRVLASEFPTGGCAALPKKTPWPWQQGPRLQGLQADGKAKVSWLKKHMGMGRYGV